MSLRFGLTPIPEKTSVSVRLKSRFALTPLKAPAAPEPVKPVKPVKQEILVYVADRMLPWISIFKEDGTFVSRFQYADGWYANDLKIANNEVYVSMLGGGVGRITVFGLGGNYLRSIGEYGGVSRNGLGTYYLLPYLAVDENHVYIMDNFTAWAGYKPFIKYTISGSYVGSYGEIGNGPGQLNSDVGSAHGHVFSGRLYVASNGNSRVEMYDLDCNYLDGFPAPKSPWNITAGENPYGTGIATGTLSRWAEVYDLRGTAVASLDGGSRWVAGISSLREKLYLASFNYSPWEAFIRVYDQNGFVQDIGSYGTEPGQFKYPLVAAVEVDPQVYGAVLQG